ncbi:MAG: ABC transporter ATP-binding protein [Thiothrix lacustris]|uniref:ABC transporter ATP-binding protein n=1 Tax=Thiothrix lacustris TaxID=525917 RepID=A0A1Y1QTZ9_9GAMM|nr:MAG: ABC transporter ATP-binding protein [Thiothrix lacustris]
MSSEFAIKVDGVGKNYRLYDKPHHRLLQMLRGEKKIYYRDFWAVNDVSFSVRKGETVGIIGRNGSGKSTLLQMICGTLTPTTGSIAVNGRVAALLELGAGFNPEFTGRENVYMNAAVLGLSHEAIDARFAQIAAFADIGDFIEQPVKTYSSGMFVRLAFAVIAHVDADILVIDEALSVGDAVFSQKCMRFLRQFKERGTLIFVSHDMGSVLNLCERALWLHTGQLRQVGASKEVAEAYLQYTLQETYGQDVQLQEIQIAPAAMPATVEAENVAPLIDYGSEVQVHDNLLAANGWKTGDGEILDVRLEHLTASPSSVFRGGEKIRLVITAKIYQDMNSPILGFLVRDRLGQDLFGENTLAFTRLNPQSIAAGKVFTGEFVFRLPMLPNGQYVVMASLANGDIHNHVQHHWLHDAVILNVSSSTVRWGLVGIAFDNVNLKEIA